MVGADPGPDEAALVARDPAPDHTREVAHAIRTMQVRGAPLIGAVAAYGLRSALAPDASTDAMEARRCDAWRHQADCGEFALGAGAHADGAAQHARRRPCAHRLCRGAAIADEDAAQCEAIGDTRPAPDCRHQPPTQSGAGQRPHPLQCRLARHGGLGHRPRADLQGA